jgi:caspase 7
LVFFLIIFILSLSDHYAWRNPKDGSWFIQSLCKELAKSSHESLSTILINVTRRVAFEYQSNVPNDKSMDGMKQIPCTVSMLTKTLYFTKKGSKDEKMEEV